MQDTVKVHVWNEHLAKTLQVCTDERGLMRSSRTSMHTWDITSSPIAHVILAYLVHPGMRLVLAPCFKAF